MMSGVGMVAASCTASPARPATLALPPSALQADLAVSQTQDPAPTGGRGRADRGGEGGGVEGGWEGKLEVRNYFY